MRKKFFFANLAGTVLCTTSLLLAGCQAIDEFFSDSSQRSYEPRHQGRAVSRSQSTQYTTSISDYASTEKKASTTTPATRAQSTRSSVPIEPPTVSTITPATSSAVKSGITTAPTGMMPPTVSQ
jgi:hypothetical protein